MFREVARRKQQLSDAECIAILKTEKRGVLAILGDDEYPYAVPLNFYYSASEHRIYFHSGKTGHKMDALARHEKVSFCVCDRGMPRENHWSLDFRSVIVFGRLRRAEQWDHALMVDFCRKYTDDMAYIEQEIAQYAENTAVLVLDIEHMTGKTINEA